MERTRSKKRVTGELATKTSAEVDPFASGDEEGEMKAEEMNEEAREEKDA
jgi:hypothetical protein